MRVSRSICLPLMPADAWSVLTDWERQADWMRDADSVGVISPTRAGPGVRLAVRTRLLGVPLFTERLAVRRWEPPTVLEVTHGPPILGTGIWLLEDASCGTALTWVEEVTLAVPVLGGPAARLYAPFLRGLMGRALADLRAAVIATGPRRSPDRPRPRP